MVIDFKGKRPLLAETAFVAPDAWVIGEVNLGEDVSVFFASVLRGDILPITVERCTNIQEHSIIHTSRGRMEVNIGEYTTVGHRAVLHGCRVGAHCLIGMGAVVLDEAIIEDQCLVAAGAVVTERKLFPSYSLIAGVPARVVRRLGEADIKAIEENAEHYIGVGAYYKSCLDVGTYASSV